MTFPDFSYEQKYWQQGYYVIGIDEVGRGALAGPVTVGAVCLNHPAETSDKWLNQGINDSKKLSSKKRSTLSQLIQSHCIGHSVVSSSVEVINQKGIVYAVETAIRQAVRNVVELTLKNKPVFLLLDAFTVDDIPALGLNKQLAIIKGDAKSLSIAAASIVAKVERDTYMSQLLPEFQKYNWSSNKGYGTLDHREAIINHGPSSLHRDLYLRNILAKATI